jgi:Lipid A core - O-antigen ligase and related enzymes
MNELQPFYNVRNKPLLWNLSLLIFISILVFNGTFFRVRPIEELPTIDWLVLSRLIACSLGFVIGVILLLKSHARFGFGSIMLAIFLAAAGVSAIGSPYPAIVIGYVILLLGASVLVFGLVQSAPDVKRLEQIEWVWLFTISICIIKDAITSFIFPESVVGGDVVRLGMGTTHANQISLLAGLVFWLSFKQTKANVILWLSRIAMLVIIIGAISRVGILTFLFGGFIYGFFRAKNLPRKAIFTLACLSGVVLFLLVISLSPHWGDKIFLYAKRGQSQSELTHMTGRTYIWKQVLEQIPESPITGHGYGLTRFTLKPISWEYQAPHAHNEFLEALFSTGLFGGISLVFLFLYTIKWITNFSRLSYVFSSDLALHASAVVAIFLISTFFEARISVRLLPFQPLFFYYLLILDREKEFVIVKEELIL